MTAPQREAAERAGASIRQDSVIQAAWRRFQPLRRSLPRGSPARRAILPQDPSRRSTPGSRPESLQFGRRGKILKRFRGQGPVRASRLLPRTRWRQRRGNGYARALVPPRRPRQVDALAEREADADVPDVQPGLNCIQPQPSSSSRPGSICDTAGEAASRMIVNATAALRRGAATNLGSAGARATAVVIRMGTSSPWSASAAYGSVGWMSRFLLRLRIPDRRRNR